MDKQALPPIVAEYRLPDYNKEFITNAAHRVAKSDAFHKEKPDYNKPIFDQHLDSEALGTIVAKRLPKDILTALRQFGKGEGAPVLILRNVLTNGDTENPLNSHPAIQHILEGLSFAIGTADTKDGIIMPATISPSIIHGQFTGTESQRYHHDNTGAFVALACLKTGGPCITTNFSRQGPEGLKTSTPTPDVVKVTLKEGDLVLFRDNDVIHGRENNNSQRFGQRYMRNADIWSFSDANPPDNWAERLQERATRLLDVPHKS